MYMEDKQDKMNDNNMEMITDYRKIPCDKTCGPGDKLPLAADQTINTAILFIESGCFNDAEGYRLQAWSPYFLAIP